MSTTDWKILAWNIRGINSKDKWVHIAKKIDESGCSVICFQETKREQFDLAFIHNFCPRRFNKFCFLPSCGRSGGLLTVWNGSVFSGVPVFSNDFSISVDFTCLTSNRQWTLTNIYGPRTHAKKLQFITWLNDIDMPDECNWIALGHFNFLRSPDDKNKPGGNINDMLMFNEAISNLGLVELPLKGRNYPWSNMRDDPLLVKLDWCFTSFNWTLEFPDSEALPLAKTTSDHVPYVIKVGTNIPRPQIFRFENHWMDRPGFEELIKNIWYQPSHLQEVD